MKQSDPDPLQAHSIRGPIAILLIDDYGVPEVRALHITAHAPATNGEKYIKHHVPQRLEAIGRLSDPTAESDYRPYCW